MKQRGFSVIEIILIVAVIGLIGVVGWLFWNQTHKETAKDTDTTSTQTEEQTTEPAESSVYNGWKDGSLITSDNLPVSFKVPADWTITQSKSDTLSNDQTATITNANGFFVIKLEISRLIRGWEADSPQVTVLDVQQTKGTDLQWVVVDSYIGTDSPKGLQIAQTQDRPDVGSKRVVGSSIVKLGEKDGAGVYLEIFGGYTMVNLSLEEFTSRDDTKQAKLIFESMKI